MWNGFWRCIAKQRKVVGKERNCLFEFSSIFLRGLIPLPPHKKGEGENGGIEKNPPSFLILWAVHFGIFNALFASELGTTMVNAPMNGSGSYKANIIENWLKSDELWFNAKNNFSHTKIHDGFIKAYFTDFMRKKKEKNCSSTFKIERSDSYHARSSCNPKFALFCPHWSFDLQKNRDHPVLNISTAPVLCIFSQTSKAPVDFGLEFSLKVSTCSKWLWNGFVPFTHNPPPPPPHETALIFIFDHSLSLTRIIFL